MKRIKYYWFYIQGLARYDKIPNKIYKDVVARKEFAVIYARYRLHRYDIQPIEYQTSDKCDMNYWKHMYGTKPIDNSVVIKIDM